MGSPEVLIGLSTLVVTLGTILWQLSSTLTALRQQREQVGKELKEIQQAIADLRTALARLDRIPVHEQRIAQLEEVVKSQGKQLSTIWRKLFSLDKHVAVVRAVSEHDLNDNDTDPPPQDEED